MGQYFRFCNVTRGVDNVKGLSTNFGLVWQRNFDGEESVFREVIAINEWDPTDEIVATGDYGGKFVYNERTLDNQREEKGALISKIEFLIAELKASKAENERLQTFIDDTSEYDMEYGVMSMSEDETLKSFDIERSFKLAFAVQTKSGQRHGKFVAFDSGQEVVIKCMYKNGNLHGDYFCRLEWGGQDGAETLECEYQ